MNGLSRPTPLTSQCNDHCIAHDKCCTIASFVARVVTATLLATVVTPSTAVAGAQGVWGHADSATVRLAPSVFPHLPAAVAADLTQRGCRIPQSSQNSVPHNVTSGAFAAPAHADWAALCSIAGVSRILVYRDGSTVQVDSLDVAADRSYLQEVAAGRIEFSRTIVAVSEAYLARHAASRGRAGPVDHQGIDDRFAGKGSTILYFAGGKWVSWPGAD
jgi:hypothetical protein